MRIPIQAWTIYDWQGPTTNVRFRVTANDSFLARDNDDSGVEVDGAPKVFREVDCTVGTAVVDGLTVKTITIPALWLFSTTDAIVNRTVRYSAKFVTKSGSDIKPLDLLQNFQLPKHIIDVFNPVPWKEIIRYNFPAAPVPIDRTTFSTEQILELIGGGAISGGPNKSPGRIAVWSGPITIDGAVGFTWQTVDNAVAALNLLPPTPTSFNAFRIAEGAGNANVKVGGSPALLSTHLTDQTGIWSRAIINDAATRRWVEFVRDGALGLQYSAYDNSNVLQSNTIFDSAGGVGFSDGTNPDFGYLFKASSAYHLGINAAGAGASSATKEITFTTSGVGINKSASIGGQLHIVSGANGRIGLVVESTASATQPIATLSKGTSLRFSFNHDAVATFGLASTVKGKLTFAVLNNANTQTIEGADTPASNITYKLPATDPANGQLLRTVTFSGGVATLEWVNPSSGGDVSSDIGTVVDNKLARFNGTTGKLITDSAIVVADTTGAFTVPNTWSLNDANGNEVITITSVASAVNQFNFSNSATNTPIVVAPTGDDANISMRYSPKGTGINEFTKNILFNVGANALDNVIFVKSTSSGAVDHSFGFFVGGVGSSTATDGPYFFARGNNFSGFASDQKGTILMVAGNITTPTGNQGKIRFMTGNEVERMNIDPLGTINVFANIVMAKDSPAIVLSDTVSGSGTDFIINFNGGATNIGRNGQSDLVLTNTSGVYTFGQIPVGPASSCTTANQYARKQYVDDRVTYFVMTYKVDDPSTMATGTSAVLPVTRVPHLTGAFMTKIHAIFMSGSHTSGGDIEFMFQNGFGDVASIHLNNTNNTIFTFYTNDFSDSSLSESSAISVYLKTKTGTITERDVNIILEGFQKMG